MDIYQLALRVRAFRKLKGLTQAQLADKMGVSISLIGKIERATTYADKLTLQLITETLGIENDELTGKTGA